MRRRVKWAVVLVLVGAAMAALPALQCEVAGHPYFRLADIVVVGTERLRPEEVLTATGIRPGTSIWAVRPAAVRGRLLRHPWVRGAAVRLELPRRVVIDVKERRPVAVVVGEGEFSYLGRDGSVFAPVAAEETPDLPCITGVLADPHGSRASSETALRSVLELLGALGRERWPGQISEIHVDASVGLTFYPVGARVAVVVGWDDWDTKIRRLQMVMERWAGREQALALIDLRFRDQVIVRPSPDARRRVGGGVRI